MSDTEIETLTPSAGDETKLRLFTRSSVQFAILENEIAAIENWRVPAPLPNAPESVLGVVGIQGRMLTVIDVAKLAGSIPASVEAEQQDAGQRILALRGDEQLALVIDGEEPGIDVSDEIFNGTDMRGLMTTVSHAGRALSVLNPKQLFLSAIQGRERRRRRF
jgi:chemotaxis signal transduction protein